MFRKAKRLSDIGQSADPVGQQGLSGIPLSDGSTVRAILFQIGVVALANIAITAMVLAAEPGLFELLPYLAGLSFLVIGVLVVVGVRQTSRMEHQAEPQRLPESKIEYSRTTEEVPIDDVLRRIREAVQGDPAAHPDALLRELAEAKQKGTIEKVEVTTEIWKGPIKKS